MTEIKAEKTWPIGYGDFNILTINIPRVDFGNANTLGTAIGNRMQELAKDQKPYKIVIDLGEVGYMSSAGIRALLAAQRVAKRDGPCQGGIVLGDVSEKVKEAIELAGFTEIWPQVVSTPATVGVKER